MSVAAWRMKTRKTRFWTSVLSSGIDDGSRRERDRKMLGLMR